VRSYLSLSQRYYWKSLYRDVDDYCRSCDTCLRAKHNYNTQVPKLRSLPVLDGPGHTWSIDHKVLTRPTRNGYTAILCMIDDYTNWPILAPVKTQTAEESARVFVREVIATHGNLKVLISDKFTSFTTQFFKHLSKLLGFTHETSASRTTRSNGLAENLVQRVICVKSTTLRTHILKTFYH